MQTSQITAKTQILNSLKNALANVEAFQPLPNGFVVCLNGYLDQSAKFDGSKAAPNNCLIPMQYNTVQADQLNRSSFRFPSGKRCYSKKLTSAFWKEARIAELNLIIKETENA